MAAYPNPAANATAFQASPPPFDMGGFDSQVAELRSIMADLDGDGIPDAQQTPAAPQIPLDARRQQDLSEEFTRMAPEDPGFTPPDAMTPEERQRVIEEMRARRSRGLKGRELHENLPVPERLFRGTPGPGSEAPGAPNVQALAAEAKQRIQAGEPRDAVIQDLYLRVTRNRQQVAENATPGVMSDAPKSYDYTPEDEFTNADALRYGAGRALRNGSPLGLGNYATAYGMADENLSQEDALRQLRDTDRAYDADYPVRGPAIDALGTVAGTALGYGAANRLATGASSALSTFDMLQRPAMLGAMSAGSAAGREVMNNPDATAEDVAWEAGPAGVAGLVSPALSAGGAAAASMLEGGANRLLGRAAKDAAPRHTWTNRLPDGSEEQIPYTTDIVNKSADRVGDVNRLKGGEIDREAGEMWPPWLSPQRTDNELVAPRALRPDRPQAFGEEMPRRDIPDPAGPTPGGMPTPQESDIEFYSERYRGRRPGDMRNVPEDLRFIAPNKAGIPHDTRTGRFRSHSDYLKAQGGSGLDKPEFNEEQRKTIRNRLLDQ